jgi:hypothetical protein
MDTIYRKMSISYPCLFDEIQKSHVIIDYDIYLLILSGNVKKYIEYLENNPDKGVSVRDYYQKLYNVKHKKSYHVYHSFDTWCHSCLSRKIVIDFVSNKHQCINCSSELIKEAERYSIVYGKKYFEQVYSLYYIFNYYDLLTDVKHYIRNLMFYI